MGSDEISHSGQPSSSQAQDENIRKDLMACFNNYGNSLIIHKVPHRLRQVNEIAYEPNVISIGPYHHGKEHLKEMEAIKKSFFDKNAGKDKEILQEAILKDVETIRKCYVGTKTLDKKKFAKMVVLDGFFIVQLFRDTPLLLQRDLFNEIIYDLLLLENQLPFFVLEKLYEKMTENEVQAEKFTDLALRFFKVVIGETKSSECPTPKENIKHMLGLIHDTPRWRPNVTEDKKDQSNGEKVKRRSFVYCASKLEETGISFEKRDAEKDKCRALDIEFKGNGGKAKLRIPKLEIDKNTESMLSNLIAFEQVMPYGEPTYVIDYVKFLDQLINSDKDVQLLCNADIFENKLGDETIVADIFNLIGDNVHVSSNFHYSDVLKQVNDHYDSSWNKHMANLHRSYFNSPWALVSFLAAVFLLFLTFAQTTFTLLTVDCRSCVVLSIVCGVLLVVIALFSCWRFS